MVVVADPLIVAISEAVGGPPEGIQSLAKFQSPLKPFRVYEAIGFLAVWPISRTRPDAAQSMRSSVFVALNEPPSRAASRRRGRRMLC
jgi:hypothetical protein